MQVACPHAADNEKRNRPFIQHEIKTRSHIEHGQKQQQRPAASLSIASWCCLCQVALGHVEAELNLIRLFFFLVCVPSSCLVFFVQLSLSSRAECHERILGDFFRPQVAALGLAGNPVGTVTNWSSSPPPVHPGFSAVAVPKTKRKVCGNFACNARGTNIERLRTRTCR